MASINVTIHGGGGENLIDLQPTNPSGSVVNSTSEVSTGGLSTSDAIWILISSFLIFTMQTGFGLLEAGTVATKNSVNIMVKNVVDVVMGGVTYWIFGFALSFGKSDWTNPFCGWGQFTLDADLQEKDKLDLYTLYVFQLSFATTATTIVSGAVAERCNFIAYSIFSGSSTLIYCIPAGWVWGTQGFLYKMGAVDIAGSGVVHLSGGAQALVAAYMLGPRLGRYDPGKEAPQMCDPVLAILGMFILWWGWLAFNCGSSYGMDNGRAAYAAAAAVMTMQGGAGGGFSAMFLSWFRTGQLQVGDAINGVLGGLVAITAGCSLYVSWEAFVVGMIGGGIAVLGVILVDKLRIDDPVGAIAVHGFCGVWGLAAVGVFVKADPVLKITGGKSGIFRGGGFLMFGIQLLMALCIGSFSAVVTYIQLKLIDFVIPIRMSKWEELIGTDLIEHGYKRANASIQIKRALSIPGYPTAPDYQDINIAGDSPAYLEILEKAMENRRGNPFSKMFNAVSRLSFRRRKSSAIEVRPFRELETRAGLTDREKEQNPLQIIGQGWT